MKKQWNYKLIGVIVLLALLISFPFFKIKYFETFSSLLKIYHYFLVIIIVLSIVGICVWYFKYSRKLNKPTTSRLKTLFQDIFSLTILTWAIILIICGLTLSGIVTTNAYFGPQKTIDINQPVIEYEHYINKQGKLQHYITFKNPTDNSFIRFEVYRKYQVGEVFNKQMKIGKWGLLYSMD